MVLIVLATIIFVPFRDLLIAASLKPLEFNCYEQTINATLPRSIDRGLIEAMSFGDYGVARVVRPSAIY